MKNLWKAYLAWVNRHEQKEFERWRKRRAKGITRFVLTTAVLWGGAMIVATTLTEYFDGILQIERLPFRITFFLIVGVVFGWVVWRLNEFKHRGKIPPVDEADLHIK